VTDDRIVIQVVVIFLGLYVDLDPQNDGWICV
jgi:hypothetical protein